MHKSGRRRKRNQGSFQGGAKNVRAKLSAEQVREIRALPGPMRRIAEAYGVSVSAVYRIKWHEVWRDVPMRADKPDKPDKPEKSLVDVSRETPAPGHYGNDDAVPDEEALDAYMESLPCAPESEEVFDE